MTGNGNSRSPLLSPSYRQHISQRQHKHPQLINVYGHWPESLLSSLDNNKNNITNWLPIYWLGKAMIGLGFDKNVTHDNSGCLKIDVHSCFSLSTHFLSRAKWGLFKIDVQNTHKHKRSYQFENKVNLYVAQAPLAVWVILRNMTPTLFSPWLKTGAPDWTHNVTQCNQKMFSCYLKLSFSISSKITTALLPGVPSLAATTPTPTPRLTPATTPTHQPSRPSLSRGPPCLKAPVIHHSYSFDETLTKFPTSSIVESLKMGEDGSGAAFPEICVTDVMGDEIKLVFSQEPMDESS